MGSTLAFMRINGRPFHFFILNIIQTLKRPSLRIWKKEHDPGILKDVMAHLHPIAVESAKKLHPPKTINYSSLKELSLILDTAGKYTGEEIWRAFELPSFLGNVPKGAIF